MPPKTHLTESLPAGAKPSSTPSSLPNQGLQLLGRPEEVRWLLIVPRRPAPVVEVAFEGGDLEEAGFDWEQLRQLGEGDGGLWAFEAQVLVLFGPYSQAPFLSEPP